MKTKSNSEKSKNEKFRGLSKYVYIHYTYIYKLCVLFCICVLGKWQQQNSFYIRRTMVKDMYKCIYIYKKKHIIYNILKSVIKHFSIKVPFFWGKKTRDSSSFVIYFYFSIVYIPTLHILFDFITWFCCLFRFLYIYIFVYIMIIYIYISCDT